jgi:hypothetical protein
LNPLVPPSSTARRYLEFLEISALPRVGQPELFPRESPEPDELAWQSRWFSGDFGREFTTLAGEPVRVVDFGWWNHGAGPDFRDCVVEIAGTARRGSIEIDLTPRDWEAHGHAVNSAYNDTLLHLFLAKDGEAKFYTRTAENRECRRCCSIRPCAKK